MGLTQQLPIDDKHTYHKDFLLSKLAILMGGRVAEELFLHHTTTGAGNDIERATELARKMVCEWGMSENMGPMTFGKKEEQIFLGREIAQHRDYSEETARKLDAEIKTIVVGAHARATELLTHHKDTLHVLAATLLEKETLDGPEIEKLVSTALEEERKRNEAGRADGTASL